MKQNPETSRFIWQCLKKLLLGKVKDTKSNLITMLEDEIKTEKAKDQAAKIALAEGNEEFFHFFHNTMHDESRHKAGIKIVLSKWQEKD